MNIKNIWLRRLARGIALWVLMFIINMFIPSWVFEGQIGTAIYTAGTWLISGTAMGYIVLKLIPGKW